MSRCGTVSRLRYRTGAESYLCPDVVLLVDLDTSTCAESSICPDVVLKVDLYTVLVLKVTHVQMWYCK